VPIVVGGGLGAVRAGAVGVVDRATARVAGLTGALNRVAGAERTTAALRTCALATAATRGAGRLAALRGLRAGSAGTCVTPGTAGCDIGSTGTTALASTATLCPGARPSALFADEPREPSFSAQAPANNAAQTSPVAIIAPGLHDMRSTLCIKNPRSSFAPGAMLPTQAVRSKKLAPTFWQSGARLDATYGCSWGSDGR
jgi:hypothetical protein